MRAPSFRFLVLVAIAAAAGELPARAADHPARFHSVEIDLLFGDRSFPDGPGVDVISGNCLACHSAGMVLAQPPLPRETWQRLVEKMRHAYKAPISNADVTPIVDYLTRLRGRN